MLSEEETRVVIKRILLALHTLHDEIGWFHRDLKMENLFLRDAADVNTLVLGDFGESLFEFCVARFFYL